MNKFDRVTSILIFLQTRGVITATELADRFGVSERTIYRDIRSLETAGVPIGSEAGVGYFLEKSYRLPPVMFTRDEAAAVLMGGKLIDAQVDTTTRGEYLSAMDKIKSVLQATDQDFLTALDDNIQVYQPKSSCYTATHDIWLSECKTALARNQVMTISYSAALSDKPLTDRTIEPIGLYYYSRHWHLIAWCRLREDYRDFRLDRIRSLELLSEQYLRRERRSLQQYLERERREDLHEIVLLFSHQAARYVGEQRFIFGFISETTSSEGVEMTFLTAQLNYFGRWLLSFTDGVELIKGDPLRPVLCDLVASLKTRWSFS